MTFSLLPHLPRSEAQQPHSLKIEKKQQLFAAKCPLDLYDCYVLYVYLHCHLHGTASMALQIAASQFSLFNCVLVDLSLPKQRTGKVVL